MGYEWDETKAASNLEKHHVDFGDAVRVFHDPLRLERPDPREFAGGSGESEFRQQTIGRVGGVILFVVSTEREKSTRLISARRATKKERRAYADPKRLG